MHDLRLRLGFDVAAGVSFVEWFAKERQEIPRFHRDHASPGWQLSKFPRFPSYSPWCLCKVFSEQSALSLRSRMLKARPAVLIKGGRDQGRVW